MNEQDKEISNPSLLSNKVYFKFPKIVPPHFKVSAPVLRGSHRTSGGVDAAWILLSGQSRGFRWADHC